MEKTDNYTTRYYHTAGCAIRRNSPTKGTQILIPAQVTDRLPLSMTDVTYPSADRFDADLEKMQETDQNVFEDYVYAFIRGVHMNVEYPMTELQIKRQLEKNQAILIGSPGTPSKQQRA